jgi:hypothetical protein
MSNGSVCHEEAHDAAQHIILGVVQAVVLGQEHAPGELTPLPTTSNNYMFVSEDPDCLTKLGSNLDDGKEMVIYLLVPV